MNKLFVPKNLKAGLKSLLRINKKNAVETDVLVFSCKKGIFALPSFSKPPVLLAKRPDSVMALAYHEGKIYDAGFYPSIYETLENKDVMKHDTQIHSLCSHNDNLYAGSIEGTILKLMPECVIGVRKGPVTSLASHEGKLYDCGSYAEVYETMSAKKVNVFINWSNSLCSHNGTLYSGCGPFILETLTTKQITERNHYIKGLCSFNGQLYDSGIGIGIFDTFDNWAIFETGAIINSMISVPRENLEGLLKDE